MTSFNWLHLTDFHHSMKEHSWAWPGVKDIFFEDLKKLHDKCGPWDIVLFSGDLTQQGSAREFEEADKILEKLWEHLKKLGSAPKLLAVPGNHDLVRPAEKEPALILMKQWKQQKEIHDEFWNDTNSPYRQVISNAFANYTGWWNKQPHRAKNTIPGLLPGDFSYTLEKEGFKLGIIGLNTAFLQLTGDDYKGKLALHTHQFHKACGGDGPEWVKQHKACILMTHHPPEWLDPESQQHLNGEITCHGRFAVHLCGHLHKAETLSTSEGGTEPRRIFQGRSLFGFEHFGQDQERLHGYTAGRIEISGDQAKLFFWPRKAILQGEQRNIAPDYSMNLTDAQHTHPINLFPEKPEKKTDERYLDAAIPEEVITGKDTELITMIRLPDSEGLRKKLNRTKSEVVKSSEGFPVEFPVDEKGKMSPADLLIRIETSDFIFVSESQQKVRIQPSADSPICRFVLRPIKTGELTLFIQVYWTDILIASGPPLVVNGRAEISEGAEIIKKLVSLPFKIFSKPSKPTTWRGSNDDHHKELSTKGYQEKHTENSFSLPQQLRNTAHFLKDIIFPTIEWAFSYPLGDKDESAVATLPGIIHISGKPEQNNIIIIPDSATIPPETEQISSDILEKALKRLDSGEEYFYYQVLTKDENEWKVFPGKPEEIRDLEISVPGTVSDCFVLLLDTEKDKLELSSKTLIQFFSQPGKTTDQKISSSTLVLAVEI